MQLNFTELMKKIFSILIISFLIFACKNKNSAEVNNAANDKVTIIDTTNYTSIQWLDDTIQEMGEIIEGQEVEVAFRFKNIGNYPLIISNVSAQCGCTIPETPTEPIAPGKEGKIKAKFNSDNRGGTLNSKEVYVDANTNPLRSVLVFNVSVLTKSTKN